MLIGHPSGEGVRLRFPFFQLLGCRKRVVQRIGPVPIGGYRDGAVDAMDVTVTIGAIHGPCERGIRIDIGCEKRSTNRR